MAASINIGWPKLSPPDTCLIRLRGTVTPTEMANVMKTAMNLSKLSAESSITLDLSLELRGEVNEHSVQMALREVQRRMIWWKWRTRTGEVKCEKE